MLRSITWKKFLEWRAFEDLEPFAEDRADWHHAHIVQAIIRDGKPLRDFMLNLGDYQVSQPVAQPLAYQERLIDTWVTLTNEVYKAKRKRP